MTDYQLPVAHLHSLGAIEINREQFEGALNRCAWLLVSFPPPAEYLAGILTTRGW